MFKYTSISHVFIACVHSTDGHGGVSKGFQEVYKRQRAQILGPSLITHDLGKGFYSLVTLDQMKIVTKRINGAHLKLYLRPPSSPHQSTPQASPHQSTLPASPHQSTPPASPHQSTPPASPHQSTLHEVLYKGNEDKRSELNHKALYEQLYSPHLLRLWRTGACELIYKAEEDDEELDVISSYSFHINFNGAFRKKHCICRRMNLP